jgi:hypothetical protein
MIRGVGMAKDEPKYRMPSQDILNKLEEVISKEMKAFGVLLTDGYIEDEIKKEKAFEASAKGASL